MPLRHVLRRFVPAALALLLCALGTWHPAHAVDEKSSALAELNQTRQLVGLPTVTRNDQLDQAAQAHADYLQTNLDGISHDETLGLPGFTGAAPANRLTAAGYAWSTVSEVISGGISGGQKAVRSLVQAIYHRFGILAPAMAEAGFGIGTVTGKSPNLVIDLGATSRNAVTMRADWLGTYPVNGQTDVVRDFLSDNETPDPVAGSNRVGYPVSIHAGASDSLHVSSFTLKPAGGAPVQVQLLASPSDPHVPTSAAAIVPLSVLDYGTQYQADFVGTRNGLPVSLSWTFTTIAYSPLKVDMPYQRIVAGQAARVQVSGGYGGISWQKTTYRLAAANAPAPTVTQISSGLFEVSASSAMEVTNEFCDAEGQIVSAILSFADPLTETVNLVSGWNLVGNPLLSPIIMLARFGSADAPVAGVTGSVVTVWKWLPAQAQWAFYAPSMTAANLAAYASKKGYAVLEQIAPGEGYWVNTKAELSLPDRTGLSVSSLPIAPLPSGWSLLGVGAEALTPAAFDKALSTGVISGLSLIFTTESWRISNGLAAVPSLKTLWSWDAASAKWRFFAPSLALQGGTALSDYATSKGYQPYDLAEHLYLPVGAGFWVNK